MGSASGRLTIHSPQPRARNDVLEEQERKERTYDPQSHSPQQTSLGVWVRDCQQSNGEARRTRHEPEVGVVQRREVGHLGLAAVRVLAVLEELVDGVDGIRLDRIVSGKDDELGDVFLWGR